MYTINNAMTTWYMKAKIRKYFVRDQERLIKNSFLNRSILFLEESLPLTYIKEEFIIEGWSRIINGIVNVKVVRESIYDLKQILILPIKNL